MKVMTRAARVSTAALLVLAFLFSSACLTSAAVRPISSIHHRLIKHRRREKIAHAAGWAGAGAAAGHFAGPAGSAAVGATKYRKDLAAGGRRRTHAAVKIGAPIAAGVIAGPAGTVGYEAVEHRNWI